MTARNDARRPRAPAVLALGLVLAGCAGGNGGAEPSPPAGSTPSAGAASPSPLASQPEPSRVDDTMFSNPVLDDNFADPFILEVDGTYYAYATGDLNVNIQVARSPNLVEWEHLGEALPRLPNWQPSAKGLTWAPEVLATPAGFVMYYTGRDVQAGKQCITTAVAATPEGPFVDDSEVPLICQVDLGGSIDGHPYLDGSTPWLIWKNDGNCCGMQTKLYAQELSADGLELVGDVHDLEIRNDAAWEGHVIEAPTLHERDGTYYLFYSANAYDSGRYAVGYATAPALLGPWQKAEENPILESGGGAAGPGHQDIVTGPGGELWMAYHAWDPERIGDSVLGRRALWIDRLDFEDGRPVVRGPTEGPQPRP